MNLSNAVALVTGAGSGIGQATTAALLEKQVRVIATDIDATRLQPLADNGAHEASPCFVQLARWLRDALPRRGDLSRAC